MCYVHLYKFLLSGNVLIFLPVPDSAMSRQQYSRHALKNDSLFRNLYEFISTDHSSINQKVTKTVFYIINHHHNFKFQTNKSVLNKQEKVQYATLWFIVSIIHVYGQE